MNSDCKKSLVANRAGVVNPEGEGEGGRDTEQGPLEECKNTAEVAGDQCRQGALQATDHVHPQEAAGCYRCRWQTDHKRRL